MDTSPIEEEAHQPMERLPACPHCGSKEVHRLNAEAAPEKEVFSSHGGQLLKCASCQKQFPHFFDTAILEAMKKRWEGQEGR